MDDRIVKNTILREIYELRKYLITKNWKNAPYFGKYYDLKTNFNDYYDCIETSKYMIKRKKRSPKYRKATHKISDDMYMLINIEDLKTEEKYVIYTENKIINVKNDVLIKHLKYLFSDFEKNRIEELTWKIF